MLLDGMFGNSSIGVLDKVISFTESRQRILANNIANIDTPGYKMKDLDIDKFREGLKKEIENRNAELPRQENIHAKVDYKQYLVFHDRNNRSIEKQITNATENTLLHNVSVELLRSRYALLERAIALRL